MRRWSGWRSVAASSTFCGTQPGRSFVIPCWPRSRSISYPSWTSTSKMAQMWEARTWAKTPHFCGQAKALGLKSSGGSCKSWRWSPKKATKWVPISWRTTQRSAKKALRRNGSERKRLLRRRKAQHLWPRPGLALALPKLWSLISAHPQANDRLWRPAFVSTMAILEATWWQRWRWCLLKGANPSQGRHTGSHTGCLPTVELWSCSGEHQRQVLSIQEHSSHTGQWPWNHHPRQAHSLLLWATARKPWDGLWIRPKSAYPWAIG